MTVQTNTNVANFLGNGAATYPIGFKFNSAADLVVQKTVISTGETTTLTLNSDYSVAGAGVEEGGSITFSQAPTSAESIKVTRVVDLLQLTDLRNQGKFYAEVHEEVFDKLVMIDQQQQTEIDDANAKADEAVAAADSANAKSDQAVAKAAQNLVDMQAQYNAFEQGASFVVIGDYAAGLVVDGYNKIFRKDGEFYRASAELELPYELTGNWSVEEALFVSVGDAVLRENLSSATGSEMIGHRSPLSGAVARTLRQVLADQAASVKDFGAVGDGVTDDTAAIQACVNASRIVFFPAGTYLVTSSIVAINRTLMGVEKTVSVLKAAPDLNAPVLYLTNDAANTSDKGLVLTLGVLGNDDHTKTSQYGMQIGAGVSGQVPSVVIRDCRVFSCGSHGIFADSAVHCTIEDNDIWFNRGFGALFNPKAGSFANANRVVANRIKGNYVGVGITNASTLNLFAAPVEASGIEATGLLILDNLIENNTNANDGSDKFAYTDRLGTAVRPGIAIFLELTSNCLISGNWIEQHYQGIKMNSLCRGNSVQNNKFGFIPQAWQTAAESAGALELCNIAFMSYAADRWNLENLVENNLMTEANTQATSPHLGLHVISVGSENKNNRLFYNRSTLASSRLTLTTAFKADNFVTDVNLTSLSVDFNGKPIHSGSPTFSSPGITSARLVSGGGITQEISDTGNAGSNDFEHRIAFVSTQHSQEKGAIRFVSDRVNTSAVLPAIAITNRSPEGYLNYPIGSIALRVGVGGGLYSKETGEGTATGWVKK